MTPPLKAAGAALLLVALLGTTTACDAQKAAPAADSAAGQGRTVVGYTPEHPLSDDQLKQSADTLRRRAEKLGLKDARVTVASGGLSLSAVGSVGSVAAALGHQPVLVFRPVLATELASLVIPGAPTGPVTSTPAAPAPGGTGSGGLTGSTFDTGTVPAALQQQFTALNCATAPAGSGGAGPAADATADTVACDSALATPGQARYKFALGPVAVKGSDVADSTAGQQQGAWTVNLRFDAEGSAAFAAMTGKLATQQDPANQLAIVLDGGVVSHPYVAQPITGGAAQISGNFTEQQAKTLAAQLSAALPVELRAGTPQ
ncbi:hypothetical protein ACFW1A_07900 [Kitasatospora sp. NPDC058965]|uniref:SecDF P1 head subdomain-containing protein n=1 Tax=Kitasatospora sp. NPDC058965 TaxID=3346682 RepID=UPI0036C93793